MINYILTGKPKLVPTKLSLFLLVGPLASLFAFNHYLLPKLSVYDITIAKFILVLAWSPLFFSLPAILMQKSRDAALPQYQGLLGNFIRGFKLIPYLLSRKDQNALETLAMLLGWTILIIYLL